MATPRSRHGQAVQARVQELSGKYGPDTLQARYRCAYLEYLAASKALSEAQARANAAEVEVDAYREIVQKKS